MIDIINGIAYENGHPIILHIIDVKPLDGHTLIATFQNGVVKEYDATPLLEKRAFQALREPEKFANITLDHGVPTWKNENLDLSPETIYSSGVDFASA